MQIIYIVLIVVFSVSCNKNVGQIELVLKLAGENRVELEKVLDYYSENNEDSLKRKAAEFLIANMIGHYSFREGAFSEFNEAVLPICKKEIDFTEKKKLIDSLILNLNIASIKPEADLKILSANYLIHNIEFSFNIWQKPWAQHLTFEQFCEYLLPYKYAELQQLDYWKDSLNKRIDLYVSEELYGGWEENYTYYIANIINEKVKSRSQKHYLPYQYSYLFYSEQLLEYTPYGTCFDFRNVELACFRAYGIPAIGEILPFRIRNLSGHGWLSFINTDGASISIPDGFNPIFGETLYPYEDYPKVFKETYSLNNAYSEFLFNPVYRSLLSPFCIDVTELYRATSNLEIAINNPIQIDDYAFIAVFDNNDWRVVDLGKIKNDKAYFNNMGRNIVYIALAYDGIKFSAISSPFLLQSNGGLKYINYNKEIYEKVVLYRKYPASNHVLEVEDRIVGGRIEASNQNDFSEKEVIYSIENAVFDNPIQLNTTTEYRYWRYYSPDHSYCNIAELKFYKTSKDSVYLESIISNTFEMLDDNQNYGIDKAFDGDHLTIFHSKYPNGNWIGIDFGDPALVNRISIIPRTDGNRVQAGDTYELVYWGVNNWISLGVKKAMSNYMEFDSVPKGALLLLHNHTRGSQERIFLYNNGIIEWR